MEPLREAPDLAKLACADSGPAISDRTLRIAMFVGYFPVVSETFITRQIVGLLKLGHEVDIYSNSRPAEGEPVHPEVSKYRLLERTIYIDGPTESTDSEMPIFPLLGRTWPPGSERGIPNMLRLLRA